ncbi:MAG TPA: alpha/beta hydrolase [Acidimicrobiales bacterium]|nr:alpha/beta hydrolase [Acidimicrobiales bacterium]
MAGARLGAGEALGDDGGVSDAYLALALVGALAVLVTFWPIRRDPLSVVCFVAGWLAGELPLQALAVMVVVTVVFGVFGAFDTWTGRAGLAVAAAVACGLVVLAVIGARSANVVAQALADATGPLDVDPALPSPAPGRWWRLTRAVPVRARSIAVVADVDYWGDGLERHRLDIYRADGPVGTGAPVMVYVHGGAWTIGDKKEQGKPMLFELVARGWVCVAVNYRLSPSATWPDHIVDVKRAVAWVKANIAEHGGDPAFVALSGGSAGGHLCALAALTPDDRSWQPGFEDADTSVDACVPFYGVYDMTASPTTSGLYGPELAKLLERKVMKTSIEEHHDLFVEASPTYRVAAGAPPFFVLHGRNDTLVPFIVARRFVEALRQTSQAAVAYAELPVAQHAFDVLSSLRCQATTAGVVAFLEAVREAAGDRAGPAPPGAGVVVPPGGSAVAEA